MAVQGRLEPPDRRQAIGRNRRIFLVAARSGEGPFTHPLQTSSIVQCEAAAR